MRIYKLSKTRSNAAMMSVREFLELVGRDEVISRFGFRAQVVSRAVKEGLFPSGWYPYIRELCEDQGVDVPEHLFRWSNVPRRQSSLEKAGLD